MKKIFALFCLFSIFFTTACGKKVVKAKLPAEPAELTKGWFQEYEDHLSKIINHNETPFMMAYKDDKKFWLLVLRSMAASESGFTPWTTYWEKNLGVNCTAVWQLSQCQQYPEFSQSNRGWDRTTKMLYLSEGLFQLSYSDHNYYGCDFETEKDRYKSRSDKTKTIFRPYRNIDCAVVILERQMRTRRTLYHNKSYWAVLRPNRQAHQNYRWYYNKWKSEYGQ